jgi:hypothetical protein
MAKATETQQPQQPNALLELIHGMKARIEALEKKVAEAEANPPATQSLSMTNDQVILLGTTIGMSMAWQQQQALTPRGFGEASIKSHISILQRMGVLVGEAVRHRNLELEAHLSLSRGEKVNAGRASA